MVEPKKCIQLSRPVPSAGYPNGVRDIKQDCIMERCEHWVEEQGGRPAHCCYKDSSDA
jgi:hypothetical protein